MKRGTPQFFSLSAKGAVSLALSVWACSSSDSQQEGGEAEDSTGGRTMGEGGATGDGDGDGMGGDSTGPDGSGGSEPSLPPCSWSQGFAKDTMGGRGGRVVKVTTLATGGQGSLYAALQETGPRIIVFEVGGVIDLQKATLPINSPYVTIAGQTAPSPGITLIRGGMKISTHDVVIQHIAVRPGEAGEEKMSGFEPDGISSDNGAYNVVVDHVSVTWGVDENLSASGDRFAGADADEWRQNTTHDVTFSNNLVAEALYDSTHGEGPHSKGSLMHDNVTGALIFGSMYVSNVERNPLFKGGARGVVANNLVINPMKRIMRYNLSETEWAGHEYQTGQMSIVGNDVRYGVDTEDDVPLLSITGVGEVELYFEDNLSENLLGQEVPPIGGEAQLAVLMDEPPTWPEGFEAMSASEVEAYVVANVGSRPWDRDPVDQRIIDDALSGDAAIIDSEQDVGGYPERSASEAEFDPSAWDLDCMEYSQ